MLRDIVLRPMSLAEGPALSALYEASPDTGRIQIAPRYHLDPYTAFTATRPGAKGIVAEDSESGRLVGAGFVHFNRVYFDGKLRDCAFLSGVVVHPDFRRQGIATRLAEWRVECARQQIGEEGLVAAGIQKENTGSLVVAKTWARQFVGQVTAGAVRMRAESPEAPAGISVHQVEPGDGDLEAVSHGLDRFYQGYNFYGPHTSDLLSSWLEQSPLEVPFNYYYVAADAAGEVLAGLAVSVQYQAIEMQVQHFPLAMRWLNTLVKFVPPDGALKQLLVSKIWFAPGQLKVAQFLWETIRWKWHEKADTLTFYFDPRSPVADVIKIPVWLPKGHLILAVSEPVDVNENTLIYPF